MSVGVRRSRPTLPSTCASKQVLKSIEFVFNSATMAKKLVRKLKSCRNIRNIYENIWPTKKCSIKQQSQFKMASKPVFIKRKFHAVCVYYHLKLDTRSSMTSRRFAQARSAWSLSISVRPYKKTRIKTVAPSVQAPFVSSRVTRGAEGGKQPRDRLVGAAKLHPKPSHGFCDQRAELPWVKKKNSCLQRATIYRICGMLGAARQSSTRASFVVDAARPASLVIPAHHIGFSQNSEYAHRRLPKVFRRLVYQGGDPAKLRPASHLGFWRRRSVLAYARTQWLTRVPEGLYLSTKHEAAHTHRRLVPSGPDRRHLRCATLVFFHRGAVGPRVGAALRPAQGSGAKVTSSPIVCKHKHLDSGCAATRGAGPTDPIGRERATHRFYNRTPHNCGAAPAPLSLITTPACAERKRPVTARCCFATPSLMHSLNPRVEAAQSCDFWSTLHIGFVDSPIVNCRLNKQLMICLAAPRFQLCTFCSIDRPGGCSCLPSKARAQTYKLINFVQLRGRRLGSRGVSTRACTQLGHELAAKPHWCALRAPSSPQDRADPVETIFVRWFRCCSLRLCSTRDPTHIQIGYYIQDLKGGRSPQSSGAAKLALVRDTLPSMRRFFTREARARFARCLATSVAPSVQARRWAAAQVAVGCATRRVVTVGSYLMAQRVRRGGSVAGSFTASPFGRPSCFLALRATQPSRSHRDQPRPSAELDQPLYMCAPEPKRPERVYRQVPPLALITPPFGCAWVTQQFYLTKSILRREASILRFSFRRLSANLAAPEGCGLRPPIRDPQHQAGFPPRCKHLTRPFGPPGPFGTSLVYKPTFRSCMCCSYSAPLAHLVRWCTAGPERGPCLQGCAQRTYPPRKREASDLCSAYLNLSSGYRSKVGVSSSVRLKRTTLPFRSAVLSDLTTHECASTLGTPSILPIYVIRRALYRTRNPKSATQLKSLFRFQLQETNKLSLLYGNLSRKQIQKICNQAFTHPLSPDALTENVFGLLERRLDVVIFRAGFCKSIFQARQWIHHKKIDINGRILTIPGYQCHPGDIISCTHHSFHHVCKHLENFYITRTSPSPASSPKAHVGHLRLFGFPEGRAAQEGLINGTAFGPAWRRPVKDPRQNKAHAEGLPSGWLRSLYIRGYRTTPFSIRTLRMRSFAIPPLNLEVNYRHLTAVYLYSPQRIILPTFVDIYLVIRGLYRY